MKKSILLLALITLVSCSTDSESAPVVKTSSKVTEKRVVVIDYNAQKVISDTGYKPNGTTEPYTYNAGQCGLILGGNESDQIGVINGVKVQVTTSFRYVVVCN
jgi:hypothetical protein